MRGVAYVAGALGLVLFCALLVRFNGHDILRVNALAGWRLFWLVPYRGVFFLLYAIGWFAMLRPTLPQPPRPQFAVTFWVTGVREAIDRLLPVASVGGAFAGVRLMRLRGFDPVAVSATIIVEVVLTLCAIYLFTVIGFLLAIADGVHGLQGHHLWLGLLCSLPVPVTCVLLLRHGRLFIKLQHAMASLVGIARFSSGAQRLDAALHALMQRAGTLTLAGGLQLAAFVSGTLEVWLAMRWFGQSVSIDHALMLEAATQAVRHLAFFVPAALGVQEAGLIAFGQALGVSPELALALSMVKRMREIVCGIPFLLSWQWVEGLQVRRRTAGVQS